MTNVAIGYLSDGNTKDNFTYSLARLMLWETGRMGMPPFLFRERCSIDVWAGRNNVTASFLDECDAEWLCFIDSDMGFGPDAIERLIESADPEKRPIVGALCFGLRRQASDTTIMAERFLTFPTIYEWVEQDDEAGFRVVSDYPDDTLMLSAATGAAFLLIHRSVLETMREARGDTWWTRVTHPKRTDPFGEDMSFCIHAAASDFPIHVNTAVKTSHDKGGVVLTEEVWQAQQALIELGSLKGEVKRAS